MDLATSPKVYLAGLISTDYPESLAWRKHAAVYLDSETISPMRDKQNLADRTTDGGLTATDLTGADIITRDYHDVSRCDVILVHLETFGSPRPLIGTVCELAWAWQMRKPIVAVVNEDNYVMRNHPFISQMVNHYFTNLSEACDFINTYYKGMALK